MNATDCVPLTDSLRGPQRLLSVLGARRRVCQKLELHERLLPRRVRPLPGQRLQLDLLHQQQRVLHRLGQEGRVYQEPRLHAEGLQEGLRRLLGLS